MLPVPSPAPVVNVEPVLAFFHVHLHSLPLNHQLCSCGTGSQDHFPGLAEESRVQAPWLFLGLLGNGYTSGSTTSYSAVGGADLSESRPLSWFHVFTCFSCRAALKVQGKAGCGCKVKGVQPPSSLCFITRLLTTRHSPPAAGETANS